MDFNEFVNITNAIQGYWLWSSKSPELSRPVAEKENGAPGLCHSPYLRAIFLAAGF